MVCQWKRIISTLSAAALLCLGAQAAFAHDHDHSHETAAPAQLTLNHGQKWATDSSLRQGMSGIRDALTVEGTSDKAAAQQYRALAQQVNDQLAFLFQNCKLDREGDAMLHIILADIIAGADAMAGSDINKAREGAEKIAHALDNYGTYFDHPGWHGIRAH